MTKKFDAVENMRRIRDELSEQFARMTFEEQRRYLDENRRPDAIARQTKRDQKPVREGKG